MTQGALEPMVIRHRRDRGRWPRQRDAGATAPPRAGRSAAALGATAACAVALALLGTLPLFVVPSPVHAQTVRYVDDDVGCDGQRPCYQSIQGAVDAADSGDILSLAAGRYTETVLVVDKALAFEGPGVGSVASPPADDEAVWSAADSGHAALTVDARSTDITGLRVTGVRLESSAAGVALVGRRSGDPVPVPFGLPPSTHDTTISGTLVADCAFVATDLAVTAVWADDLSVERIASNGGRVEIAGGNRALVADSAITTPVGAGVRLLVHGGGHRVERNTITAPDGRGIEVRPLVGTGLSGLGEDIAVIDNEVMGAGREGVLVSGVGGTLTYVQVRGGSVTGAGGAPGNEVLGAVAVVGIGETGSSGEPDGGVEAEGGPPVAAVGNVAIDATRRPTGTESVGAGVYATAIAGTIEISGVVASGGAGPGLALVDVPRARVASSSFTGNEEGVLIVEKSPASAGTGDVVIGGAPELGNVISGNDGGDLVLRNDTGSAVSTADVDATYNDWGAAYAPAIEERVHHRPDSVVLGLVSYVPALGAPHELRLESDPPDLVADGESTGDVTVNCLDAAGRGVADGTLVALETSAGSLAEPGLLVEAESDTADLPRSGEWGVFDSFVFGPYSGTGYVRSYDPGAWIAWTFEASAVLARYGQAVLNDGSFRAEVDGVDRGSFSTRGPEKAWVDRVLASELGPGPHSVTITIEAGEVNLDLLRGGVSTTGGAATTALTSTTEVGLSHVGALAFGANGPVAGSLDVPFTAGRPKALTVTLGSATLPVGNVTTTVAVEARDLVGRPVPDGTLVELATTLGDVSPEHMTTLSGLASAVLSSGDQLGAGLVHATSEGAFASAPFTVTAAAPAELRLQPSRTALPANSHDSVDLAIAAWDRFGNPAADGTPIHLGTTLGTVSNPSPPTLGGIARAKLIAAAEMGIATVRATHGEVSDEAVVSMTGTDVSLEKAARPLSAVVPGERVTFTLKYANESTGSVYDLLIEDILPTGLISPVVQTSPGQQLTRLPDRPLAFIKERLRPAESGTITVALRVDTSLRWGSRTVIENLASAVSDTAAEVTPRDNESAAEVVVLSGAVYTVTLAAPQSVPVGGATGQVRATLTDRYGNPARDDTVVAFSTDLGQLDPVVVRTSGGVAETTFTSGTESGPATVQAITADERGASAVVTVRPGPAAELGLESSATSLEVGGQTAVISATLRDQYDNGIGGAAVVFAVDNGLLSEAATKTGPSGLTTVTLRSSVRAGTALVVARAGALTEELEVEFRPGPVADVSLTLEKNVIAVGEAIEAEAVVFDAYGNPVPEAAVEFETTIGRVSPAVVPSELDGRARATVRATAVGRGVVRASVDATGDSRNLTVLQRSLHIPLAFRH